LDERITGVRVGFFYPARIQICPPSSCRREIVTAREVVRGPGPFKVVIHFNSISFIFSRKEVVGFGLMVCTFFHFFLLIEQLSVSVMGGGERVRWVYRCQTDLEGLDA